MESGTVAAWVGVSIIVLLNVIGLSVAWGKLSGALSDINNRLKLIEGCFEVQLKPKPHIFKDINGNGK